MICCLHSLANPDFFFSQYFFRVQSEKLAKEKIRNIKVTYSVSPLIRVSKFAVVHIAGFVQSSDSFVHHENSDNSRRLCGTFVSKFRRRGPGMKSMPAPWLPARLLKNISKSPLISNQPMFVPLHGQMGSADSEADGKKS